MPNEVHPNILIEKLRPLPVKLLQELCHVRILDRRGGGLDGL